MRLSRTALQNRDPVLMLVPAYRAIEAAARRRGFDPDNPPYLRKVTQTL